MRKEKLDFWLEKNLNVLFIGKHGVGKSSMVLDAFNRAGLKYLYFSGSTMDPFVDFCGIPIQTSNEDGSSSIELVMPKHIPYNEVEAIFLDEYNRAKPKIINATMELIQFKSINGKKFPKLRVIWAAINPENENEDVDDFSYSVEKLDPAQKDRFQVHVEIPYTCDKAYFTKKYGKEISSGAIEWWNNLETSIKNLVSPRRLDYTISHYINGGELKDILPREANASSLALLLASGSIYDNMIKLLEEKDLEKSKSYITNIAQRDYAETCILQNLKILGNYFIPLMDQEQATAFFSKNNKKELWKLALEEIVKEGDKSPLFEVLQKISLSGRNEKLRIQANSILKEAEKISPEKIDPILHRRNMDIVSTKINLLSNPYNNTYDRMKAFKSILRTSNKNLSKEALISKFLLIDYVVARSQQMTLESVIRQEKINFKKEVQNILNIFVEKYNMDDKEINKLIYDSKQTDQNRPMSKDIFKFFANDPLVIKKAVLTK